MVVRRERDGPRPRRVQVGELDLVLRADLVADHDLVDVVELVPVVLVRVVVACGPDAVATRLPCGLNEDAASLAKQRLELGPAGDRQVQRLRREEAPAIKEVEVVRVEEVRHELAREPVQRTHDWHGQRPLFIGRTVHVVREFQGFGVVEPVADGGVVLRGTDAVSRGASTLVWS